MSAIDRARLLHWDVTPCPASERDEAGKVIAQSIRVWNQMAHKSYLEWKRLGDDLGLTNENASR